MAKLTGKRVLITGASSGVGKATAELFVAEGATVGLIARRADVLAGIVADLARNSAGRAMALPADVADDKAVAAAVEFRTSPSLDCPGSPDSPAAVKAAAAATAITTTTTIIVTTIITTAASARCPWIR